MAKEIGKCPNCGGQVYETAKGFACANWSDETNPCRFTIWKESYGADFDEADAVALLNGKHIRKQNVTMDGEIYDTEWFLVDRKDRPVFRKVS